MKHVDDVNVLFGVRRELVHAGPVLNETPARSAYGDDSDSDTALKARCT